MTKGVIIITGASSGIGEALALFYAKAGWSVVIAARGSERLEKVALACEKAGAAAVLPVICDVTDELSCKNLIEKTVASFGGIDVLVNNAGISMRALFKDCGAAVLHQVMNVNFWGTVYCTQYALPYLLASKGSLVGVSSVAGYKGLPARTGYTASKFAMNGFLEALRIEHLKQGLHILIACPGFTASNIRQAALNARGEAQGESPLDEGSLMSADEVAVRIARGIAKRKREVIITPLGFWTIFMNKFFPSFVDRRVYQEMHKEPGSPF